MQIADGIAHAVLQPRESLIGFPLRNRQTYFARADLHPLQADARVQDTRGDELLGSLLLRLQLHRGVADVLIDHHAGHEQNADTRRQGELRANTDVQAG